MSEFALSLCDVVDPFPLINTLVVELLATLAMPFPVDSIPAIASKLNGRFGAGLAGWNFRALKIFSFLADVAHI